MYPTPGLNMNAMSTEWRGISSRGDRKTPGDRCVTLACDGNLDDGAFRALSAYRQHRSFVRPLGGLLVNLDDYVLPAVLPRYRQALPT